MNSMAADLGKGHTLLLLHLPLPLLQSRCSTLLAGHSRPQSARTPARPPAHLPAPPARPPAHLPAPPARPPFPPTRDSLYGHTLGLGSSVKPIAAWVGGVILLHREPLRVEGVHVHPVALGINAAAQGGGAVGGTARVGSGEVKGQSPEVGPGAGSPPPAPHQKLPCCMRLGRFGPSGRVLRSQQRGSLRSNPALTIWPRCRRT